MWILNSVSPLSFVHSSYLVRGTNYRKNCRSNFKRKKICMRTTTTNRGQTKKEERGSQHTQARNEQYAKVRMKCYWDCFWQMAFRSAFGNVLNCETIFGLQFNSFSKIFVWRCFYLRLSFLPIRYLFVWNLFFSALYCHHSDWDRKFAIALHQMRIIYNAKTNRWNRCNWHEQF